VAAVVPATDAACSEASRGEYSSMLMQNIGQESLEASVMGVGWGGVGWGGVGWGGVGWGGVGWGGVGWGGVGWVGGIHRGPSAAAMISSLAGSALMTGDSNLR